MWWDIVTPLHMVKKMWRTSFAVPPSGTSSGYFIYHSSYIALMVHDSLTMRIARIRLRPFLCTVSIWRI